MAVYEVVLGAASLCAILTCTRLSPQIKNFLYRLCAGVVVVLSAIRGTNVGADTTTYCQAYRYIRRLSFAGAMNYGWEQGYVAVNWLLGQIFKSERALIVFLSFFILVPIFRWIKKESQWPALSIVIFVGMGMWGTSMGILRQWSAMAILTYSYKYIKQKKFIPFVVIVLIAMLFHRTAAIFILAYFIANIPLNKSIIVFSIPFSVALGLLGGKILTVLNRFARIAEAGNFSGGVSMLIVLWLCILAGLVCFKGKIPEKLDFYFRFVFLAAFLQPIAFTFSNWARIVVYFSIALVIYLPNFVAELTNDSEKNRAFRLPLGIVVCMLMFVWFKSTNVQPYTFWLK